MGIVRSLCKVGVVEISLPSLKANETVCEDYLYKELYSLAFLHVSCLLDIS